MGESLKCIQRAYNDNMGSNQTEVVHSRIPPALRKRMGDLILRDYENESRFIKEAIVEKVKREE